LSKPFALARRYRALACLCGCGIAVLYSPMALAQPADPPQPNGGIIDELLIVERDGFNIVPGLASKVGRFFGNNTAAVNILGHTASAPIFIGMDFKPGTSTLFGIEITSNSLRSISAINALSTVVGAGSSIPLDPFRLGGMSFNANGDVLYVTDSSFLYTVDDTSGVVLDSYTLNYTGLPPGLDIGDIAVAPIEVSTSPPIPAGTLLGIAVNSAFGQPALLVKITPDSVSGQAAVTSLATLTTGAFVIGFYDQGLDFSPQGVLYACLQGEFQSATLFRVNVSGAATMGQCTFMGIVHGNPASWDVGDLTVGPNPIFTCPTCRGDMTGDNMVNGRDIQRWTTAAIDYAITQQIASGNHCADMNADGDIDCVGLNNDLDAFITRVMSATPACQP